jgi:hypothetical protein
LHGFFARKVKRFFDEWQIANGAQIQQILGHKFGCTARSRMLKKFNGNFWLVKMFGEIDPWKKSFSRKD